MQHSLKLGGTNCYFIRVKSTWYKCIKQDEYLLVYIANKERHCITCIPLLYILLSLLKS